MSAPVGFGAFLSLHPAREQFELVRRMTGFGWAPSGRATYELCEAGMGLVISPPTPSALSGSSCRRLRSDTFTDPSSGARMRAWVSFRSRRG